MNTYNDKKEFVDCGIKMFESELEEHFVIIEDANKDLTELNASQYSAIRMQDHLSNCMTIKTITKQGMTIYCTTGTLLEIGKCVIGLII